MAIRGGWVRKAAAVCALGIAALVLFFLRLEWMDRRHDEFYRSGKSINDFLKGYCQALTGGSLGGGPDELLAFYSDAYRAPGRGSWRWQERAKEPAADSGIAPAAGVRVFDLEKEGDAAFGLGDLEEELRSSLEGFSAVDGAACKIALIEEIEPGRRATLTVRQTLDRRDEEGLLLEDRLLLRWQLQASLRDPVGWRITADALLRGVRVAGDGHRLLAADTRMLGVDYEQRIDPRLDRSRPDSGLKFALIGHSSGGLSAVDYDQDGRPDLLFLDGVHTRLYRGEGPGEDGLPRFSDVTAEAGLEGVGKTQAGVFADFDNDGDRDLFVGGHLAPSRFYRNRGDG
ncbi:MAG: VCBS repeat-containing protein, partial [Acidobacteria bacterium]|nr:VCBS repeat-containing protein [Acidobacteriota bacterium]